MGKEGARMLRSTGVSVRGTKAKWGGRGRRKNTSRKTSWSGGVKPEKEREGK